ncbi:glutathionylspermidine synthase family protein [Hymenobacter sp. 5516J-16]|uniref:glutathionylspermidine synthase family protein n=1 Tax=Hymenobacter sp. 5516J-16 TaxID=2932253 RepID=UPI0021D4336D|nr:glutathionylspermidine synthase family protein [Hymenobacter sp. 5516J-16]
MLSPSSASAGGVSLGSDRASGKQTRVGPRGQDIAELGGAADAASSVAGDYADQPIIYQRFAELPTDASGRLYQAGVFWAGGACAIGYRREVGIITNLSEFVPHVLT